MDVEIVEATPVSDSDDIKVTSKFAPQPDDLSWHDRQGMVAWKKSLDGGQQTSVGASYTVQYPGERTIVGLP